MHLQAGSRKTLESSPSALRKAASLSDGARSSVLLAPILATVMPVIAVNIINAVGLAVGRQHHPGRRTPVFLTYVRMDLSMSRQIMSAMIRTIPSASILEGVLRKMSFTTSGSLRKAKSLSTLYWPL